MERYRIVSIRDSGERAYPFGETTFRRDYAEARAERLNAQAAHANSVNDDAIRYEAEMVGQECQWFAACFRAANGTQTHPILGEVPICDPCREFVAG